MPKSVRNVPEARVVASSLSYPRRVTVTRGQLHDPALDLFRRLYDAGPHDLPDTVEQLADAAGCGGATIYVTDLQQNSLVPYRGLHSPAANREPRVLPVASTLAGRCYQQQQLLHRLDGDETSERVWLPLSRGSERLGVLEIVAQPAEVTPTLLVQLVNLASALAHVLACMAPIVDTIANLRRTGDMGLAADLQWSLLPPLTYADAQVSLAGALEPAYDVAGDSVDYGVENGAVQFAVFDSMGHGLASAMAAVLAVGCYRNNRRRGASPSDNARIIDAILEQSYAGETFTTALLARLDLDLGVLSWISAGHHAPLLFREGRFVKELESTSSVLPLGAWWSGDPTQSAWLNSEQLQPRDHLLVYTDGMVDARSDTGEPFGLERLIGVVERSLAAGASAPETLRRVTSLLLEHHPAQLNDDASLLLVEWTPAAR